jgi:TraC-like protein
LARKTLIARRAGKLAQLDSLKAQIAEMEEKAAQHLGKLAVRAGLADLDLKDEELLRGFKAMAARFRGSGNSPEQGQEAPEPGSPTGKEG